MVTSTQLPRAARRVLPPAPPRERARARYVDAEIESWIRALSGEPITHSRCERHAGGSASELGLGIVI